MVTDSSPGSTCLFAYKQTEAAVTIFDEVHGEPFGSLFQFHLYPPLGLNGAMYGQRHPGLGRRLLGAGPSCLPRQSGRLPRTCCAGSVRAKLFYSQTVNSTKARGKLPSASSYGTFSCPAEPPVQQHNWKPALPLTFACRHAVASSLRGRLR